MKAEELTMKWNDYKSDSLYLWNGKILFVITEGDGSNLLDEDIEDGYEDYWVTNWYETNYTDGGQWMETKPIKEIDYTILGVIKRILDCDLWEDDWIILDDALGSELANQFYDYWAEKGQMQYLENELQSAIEFVKENLKGE